ncbi:hypothetical protein [Paraburkholderia diazotrophica]|uniref:Uncharacterized protein n=1 Tax=Paraburkholderia diazotrophica TaxID=667676 RepID=A0A1H6SER3_9BURK|nr:hypothetical protein [Paraburkholderia diazotrophica]SEI66508.1 hypothetical protein SAMN05192539_1003205 [Paraburkholderia diazotrophica]
MSLLFFKAPSVESSKKDGESVWVFSQSLIECLLKAGALLALGFSRASRASHMAVIAWNVVSESSSNTLGQR